MPERSNGESTMRKFCFNFVVILMLSGIVYHFYNKSQSDGRQEQPDKEKIVPREYTLYIILGVVLIIFCVFFQMISESKVYQKEAKVTKPIQKSYTKRMTTNEYNHIAEETTKKELDKLYQSREFQEMIKRKGTDPSNWVWQTKEKEKRTVWREDNDDDVSNLSQITLSDN